MAETLMGLSRQYNRLPSELFKLWEDDPHAWGFNIAFLNAMGSQSQRRTPFAEQHLKGVDTKAYCDALALKVEDMGRGDPSYG